MSKSHYAITIASLAFLLGAAVVFPAMAESPLRIVADSVEIPGKVFVSVDFDHDGFCDKQSVLISVSTVEKIGITGYCVLPSI